MFSDGRGRWQRWDKKTQTTELLRLSAHQVARSYDPARRAYFSWQWSRGGEPIANIHIEVAPDAGGVRLHYTYQKQPVEPYLVRWAITMPHYGGKRYWWLCPKCGRRCAYLYGGKIFACRTCHDLTYESAQSGDPRQARVERRMQAIRRRLGGGGLWDELPAKPPYMHLDTYLRLWCEYDKLLPIFWGEISLMVGLGDEHPDLKDLTDQCWADYERAPADPPADLVERTLAYLHEEDEARPPARRRPVRRTLPATAKSAEIPVEFAREAQAEGLLRPDAGRTARRKRYRPKLASWLAKLYTLRQAGYTWADLRAWSGRRFLPEHEQERCWPAGYTVAPTT